ncbi:NAD-dependent epimerase/dehydratase family protein [Aureimonas psammosilenae]|uniref:NAD-dependent epimerase/dehydratase family protein n=1 Tax=Aureimonas psammosilenae TaxID=2495496 RepID=UPI0012607041|nr:NAD-dependent epimerase/dehydratase family protein [Aureimonas psammosilenae]
MPGPTIALTGATGFLGTHLGTLLTERGFHLKALTRAGVYPPFRCETVTGRLDDEAALDRLLADADFVLHVAGLTKALGAAEFHAVNGAGTARLMRRVVAVAPDSHVTLVSSLAAREPGLSAYAASKAAGEEEARRLIDPSRLLVIRPPALYGPGDKQTLELFKAAQLPLVPLPGTGRERIAVLHVTDAAEAIADLLQPRETGAFTLADSRPEGYTLAELFREAARAQGRNARFMKVPTPALRLLGRVAEASGHLLRRPPLLSQGKLAEMLHEDWSVDPALMPNDLLRQARGIRQGFTETVTWYEQAGWL